MGRFGTRVFGLFAAGVIGSASIVATQSAAHANYDGCPDNSVCLYQHGNGTGSKAILPGNLGWQWDFGNLLFINGQNVNDQVSSVYNKTRYCVQLFVDFGGQPTFDTGFVGPNQQADYSYGTVEERFNDKFSSAVIRNCA